MVHVHITYKCVIGGKEIYYGVWLTLKTSWLTDLRWITNNGSNHVCNIAVHSIDYCNDGTDGTDGFSWFWDCQKSIMCCK